MRDNKYRSLTFLIGTPLASCLDNFDLLPDDDPPGAGSSVFSGVVVRLVNGDDDDDDDSPAPRCERRRALQDDGIVRLFRGEAGGTLRAFASYTTWAIPTKQSRSLSARTLADRPTSVMIRGSNNG